MCDYIYLNSENATVDSDYNLNWTIDETRFKHKDKYKKAFVSVAQMYFSITHAKEFDVQSVEIVTNLHFKDYFNTYNKKVLTLADTVYNTDDAVLMTVCSTPNYSVRYETDIQSIIQLAVCLSNENIEFNKANSIFSCLLKFEYEL